MRFLTWGMPKSRVAGRSRPCTGLGLVCRGRRSPSLNGTCLALGGRDSTGPAGAGRGRWPSLNAPACRTPERRPAKNSLGSLPENPVSETAGRGRITGGTERCRGGHSGAEKVAGSPSCEATPSHEGLPATLNRTSHQYLRGFGVIPETRCEVCVTGDTFTDTCSQPVVSKSAGETV